MANQTVFSYVARLKDEFSAPLRQLTTGLANVRAAGAQVGAALSPIFNQLTGAIAAVASISAARSAIEAAREAVQSEQRLLVALRGRRDALEQILRATKAIGEAAAVDDDQLNDIAATLVNMGLSADRIPRAIEVIVDTAKALNLSFEAVAISIGKIAQGGGAGGIGKLLPQLKDIVKEGATLDEVFSELETRFSGTAAAAAATQFGELDRQLVSVGNTMEDIGKALVPIAQGFERGLGAAARTIADFVQSDSGRTFVAFLATAAESLPKIALAVGAIGAGFLAFRGLTSAVGVAGELFKLFLAIEQVVAGMAWTVGVALLNAFGAVAAAVGAIAGPWAGVLTISISIAAVLTSIVGGWKLISAAVAEASKVIGFIASDLGRVFELIGEGKLSFDDLGDALVTRVRQLKVIGGVLIDIGKAVGEFFLQVAHAVVSPITFAAKEAANLVGRTFLNALEGVFNALAFISDKFNTDLGNTFRDLAKKVAEFQEDLFKNIPRPLVGFGDVIKEQIEAVNKSVADAAADIVALEVGMNVRRIRSIKDHERAKVEADVREIESEVQKQQKIEENERQRLARSVKLRALAIATDTTAATTGFAIEEAARMLRTVEAETREPLRKILVGQLEQAFRAGKVAAEDFVDFRRRLELELIDEERKALEEQRGAAVDNLTAQQSVSSAIDQQATGLATALGFLRATNASQETIAATAQDLLKTERALTEARGKESDAATELVAIDERIAELAQKRVAGAAAVTASRRQEAEGAVSVAKTQIESAERAAQRSSKLFAEGFGSFDDAMNAASVAANTVDSEVAKASKTINSLLQGGTGAPPLLEDLQRLESTLANLGETKVTITLDVAGGVVNAAQEARRQFDEALAESQRLLQAGSITNQQVEEQVQQQVNAFRARMQTAFAQIESLRSAAPDLARQLTVFRDQLNELDNRVQTPPSKTDFFGGIRAGIQQTLNDLSDLNRLGVEVGSRVSRQLAEGLVDQFVEAKQSFDEFLQTFLRGVAIMILKMVALAAIALALNAIPGFAAVATAASAGSAAATKVQGKAQGGYIDGPPVDADVVPAMLMPGEFVVRKAAVARYGRGVLEALNRMAVPPSAVDFGLSSGVANIHRGFATGGEVSAQPAAGRSAVSTRAIVAPDEITFERLLAGGGGNALIRWARRSADFRNAIFEGKNA